jgi:serine/threonine protein kinase
MSALVDQQCAQASLQAAVRLDHRSIYDAAYHWYGRALSYLPPSAPEYSAALARANWLGSAHLSPRRPPLTPSDFLAFRQTAYLSGCTLSYPDVSMIGLASPARPQFFLADFVVNLQDFEILRSLGNGSFGSVVQARDRRNGRLVAVKTLNSNRLSFGDQVALLREVESLARVRHPAILRFCGFNLESKPDQGIWPTIVTEFVPNGSLESFIQNVDGQLTATHKMIILYGVAAAMQYLHETAKIVHRDLKPANVMLDADLAPIVADFGLAKIAEPLESMRQTRVQGSPIYMAPELHEDKQYTNSVDMYAYAMLAYELLSQTLAFDSVASVDQLKRLVVGGVRPAMPAGLPAPFARFIETGWDKDPTRRPTFTQVVGLFTTGKLGLKDADMGQFRQYVQRIDREARA